MHILLIQCMITALSDFLRTLLNAPRENQTNSFKQFMDWIHSVEVIKHVSTVWHMICSQFNKTSRLKQIMQQAKSDLGIDYPHFKEPG